MMTNKKYIIYGILIVGGIILCLFIGSLFSRPKQQTNIEVITKLYDSLIASIQRERNLTREMYDNAIAEAMQRDTVLIKEYKTNTIRYEAIPVYINNLSDDSLRAAVEGFR